MSFKSFRFSYKYLIWSIIYLMENWRCDKITPQKKNDLIFIKLIRRKHNCNVFSFKDIYILRSFFITMWSPLNSFVCFSQSIYLYWNLFKRMQVITNCISILDRIFLYKAYPFNFVTQRYFRGKKHFTTALQSEFLILWLNIFSVFLFEK
jgi:hypothetical protein